MVNRLVIIFFIILSVILYTYFQNNSLESQLSQTSETILKRLPDSKFSNLNGTELSSHGLFAPNLSLLIVHFWGTWCAPCEAELPDLMALAKNYEGRTDIKFLIVAVNDTKINVEKHLKTISIPKADIIWVLDNKNIHRDVFGTTRVPETYVFSSDKVVLKKYMGPQEWNRPIFLRNFNEFVEISTRKL